MPSETKNETGSMAPYSYERPSFYREYDLSYKVIMWGTAGSMTIFSWLATWSALLYTFVTRDSNMLLGVGSSAFVAGYSALMYNIYTDAESVERSYKKFIGRISEFLRDL